MNNKTFSSDFLRIGSGFLLLMFLMISCDSYNQDRYVEQYVIEAFLTAGEPLSPVKLSTTLPFNQTYSFEAAAVSGADIVVRLVSQNGNIEAEYQYAESDTAGIYQPVDSTVAVMPGRRYQIEVANLNQPDESIWASTFVPGYFESVAVNTDTLVYQGPVQFESTFTQGFYPGRQNIYVASTLALEPENFSLTPFYADIDGEPEDYIRVSSGLVNEGNYDLNDDGTLTLKYPWIGIAYYGPNELSIYAVDTNIYDYIRSVDIQAGGSTLSPGQIENVLWNVEGGIGIFGSRTGIKDTVFIEKPF